MKTLRLALCTIALLLCSIAANARDLDFSVDSIYYFSTSDSTVAVTSSPEYYSGDVSIPSTVTYENKTYSVTSIENYAFGGCVDLSSITIPESVTSIGNFAFYHCEKLSSITIPESVTSIGESSFSGCTNLKDVNISGYGMTSIGNYAFSGCSSLDKFEFGCAMESIGKEAFSDCANLTSIIIPAIIPPVCGEQALNDIDKLNCVLRVPSGYAEAYQKAEQWKVFSHIEDVLEIDHFALTYSVDGEIYHRDTLAYKESIVLPEEPTKVGHTFNVWDGLPETMPAQDLTINASFTVNTYKVYYYVGEELVHTAEVAYGDTIPEYIYEPSAEGEVFKGWEGETYETMPAHDVTYKANIIIINGINSVLLNPSSLIIYDLQGRKITNTENLQNGIYIINDQKVLIQK